MNCPNCNKKMEIMCWFNSVRLSNGLRRTEVLGNCSDCDFNATLRIDTDSAGAVIEYDLKKYFLDKG